MNKKGFTMIELLVVVAIVGLLSTIVIFATTNSRMKSRDGKRMNDINKIQTVLEMFYSDQGFYPDAGALGTTIDLGGPGYTCLDKSGFSSSCSGLVYMLVVPSNPLPRADKSCENATAGYFYKSDNFVDASTYRIQYCLGETTSGVGAGVNYACSSGRAGCSW